MPPPAKRKHPLIGYPLGLLLWLGAFVIGNLLGRVAASLQGWDNFSYDRPGAVLYSGIQAGIGSYLALLGAKKWLGDSRFTRFWLLVFEVIIGSALILSTGYVALIGRFDAFDWSTLCTAVFVVVTEVVRRIPDSEFQHL